MAYQPLNLGSSANDGTGDTPRVAGQKINDNFAELYDELDEHLLHQLRVSMISKIDGSVDGSDNPIDVFGGFTYSAVGALSTQVESSGPISGRTVLALNGTDAAVTCEQTGEVLLTDNMTIAGWWHVDSAVDLSSTSLTLFDCSDTGETRENNILYSAKHDSAQTTPGAIKFSQEYGTGSDLDSQDNSFVAPATVGEWVFLVISRKGKDIQISTYKNSAWYHEYATLSGDAEKATSLNTQILHLFESSDGSSKYSGRCGGVGIWGRALSRKERIDLMDVFFDL